VYRLALVGVVVGIAIAPRIAERLPVPHFVATAHHALDSIRLDDGLSEEEASAIARVFFLDYFQSSCGGAFDPRYHEVRWTFQILLGALGDNQGVLEIEASTGRMTFVPTQRSGIAQVEFPSLTAFLEDDLDRAGRLYRHERLRHVSGGT
jgi:hypothetical protein